MTVYLVVLEHPDKKAWQRLKDEWPKPRHYILTEQIAFVAPEQSVLTEDVGDIVGMNEAHEVSGVVTEVMYTTINGWALQSVWEWLRKHQ